jgi:predicted nucleic acid-binding protein
VEIVSIDAGLEFMRQQMIDYGDLPCDFADASLLYAVWSTKIRDVWTIDSDFAVYRLPDRSRFKVSPSR